MTIEHAEPDLSTLPLDDLIAALQRHGATPGESLHALLDRGLVDERQVNRIARRLAKAVGSRTQPLIRRGGVT